MRVFGRGVLAGSLALLSLSPLTTSVASAAPAPVTAPSGQAPLSAAQAAALSINVTDHVIIVMRAQPTAPDVAGPQAAARAHSVTETEAPVVSELQRTAARNVHTYSLVDAVSATVSPGEAGRLAANPSVSEVIADSRVRGPDVAAPATSSDPSSDPVPSSLPIPPGACPAPGQPAYIGE